jgi:hypothetical protein
MRLAKTAARLAFPSRRLHTGMAPGFPPGPPIVGLSSTFPLEEEHLIQMSKRIVITLAFTILALAVAGAALAGTLTTTATVAGTAGVSLNLPANPTITSTLDGSDQIATYTPLLSMIDARGGGAGWNIQISATVFTDSASHTLAPGSVASVAQACTIGSTCTLATSSGITYPLAISTTPGKLFSAALNTGLGKLNITPTINVAIPGNAYAGSYTSTVTLAATTGP